MDMERVTPPGSPILGYSGMRDSPRKINVIHAEESATGSNLVLMFNCKGYIVPNDSSFSPNGYFRQNHVSCVTRLFKYSMDNELSSIDDTLWPRMGTHKFFGHDFQPAEEEDLKVLISMCRKRTGMVESMSRAASLAFHYGGNRSTVVRALEEDDAFALRLEISRFLNFLVQNRASYLHLDTRKIFNGLILSLGSVKEWPTSLQYHSGSSSGNQCTSSEFHFFHLSWELRWTLLVFFRLSDELLNLVLDDLLHLSFLKFKTGSNLITKSPFNCYCIMEFWAMLRLLVEEFHPNGNSFCDVVKSGIGRMPLDGSELFPLWLTCNLSQLIDYDITGEKNSLTVQKGDGNELFHHILKDWVTTNGDAPPVKTVEMHSLLRHFLPHFGFDLTLFTTLWAFWLPKLDKGFEVRNMDYYTSSTKWVRLVTRICDTSNSSETSIDASSSEPFHSFLLLLVEIINQSTVKEWRKLSSTICNRLTPKIVENFGENGLTRMITLFLCMSSVSKSNSMDTYERLNETLNGGKESVRLVKIRGRCAMILLLLQKSLSVGSCCGPLMKTVDDIMGTIHRSPAEREIVMTYLDLIENLPKVSPHSDLDQSKLISVNLNPWLASCGPNYVVRTLRILHSLYDSWLLDTNTVPTSEKSRIAKIVLERTDTFLQQSVVGNLDSIDVEPFGELAVDFTVFLKLNRNYAGAGKLFQLFALSARTSPKVSEVYLDHLVGHSELDVLDNSFVTEIQLVQSWIRLLSLGGIVPLKLTAKLLSPHTQGKPLEGISSTTGSDVLLRRFCDFVNSSECFWSKGQMGDILSPIGGAIKLSLEKSCDSEVMESVVRSSVLVLRKIQLDKLYARNSHSGLLHQVLEDYVPSFLGKPPWEKLSPGLVKILSTVLHQIFIFISFNDWLRDPFLKRKLCDTFRFAFLGFVTTGELEEENPGLLIMRHIEAMHPVPEVLLTEVMLNLQQLTKEEKLMKRFLLASLGFLKRRMTLTSAWLFGPILELMVEKDTEVGTKCSGILTNSVLLILSNRDREAVAVKLIPRLITAFETIMTKHFSFRSKRFFDFFNGLATYGTKKPIVADFIHREILPLLRTQVGISEAKQGSGSNYAMRTQLKILEVNVTKTMSFRKTE